MEDILVESECYGLSTVDRIMNGKSYNRGIRCHKLLYEAFSRLKLDAQGWISDMGIDGPTFVPKSGYFLLIWVKVCPQKLAFS